MVYLPKLLFIVGQYSTWTQDSLLVNSIVGLEFQSRQGSGTLISSQDISFCKLQNLLPHCHYQYWLEYKISIDAIYCCRTIFGVYN